MEMPAAIVILGIIGAVVGVAIYFIPFMVARRRRSPHVMLVFMVNLLFGWSGLGWLAALALAIMGGGAFQSLSGAGSGGGTGVPAYPSSTPSWEPSREPQACGNCRGGGTVPCTVCAARGSWWEPPTTASGSPQLRTCTMCTSSGKVTCTSCGGSGRVR